MAIKVDHKNLKVVSGKKPIRAILIGPKCVYGDDLSLYHIDYPVCPEGVKYHIYVNGYSKINSPSAAGKLAVHYGDTITLRTYAKSGFYNPTSSVINRDEPVSGEILNLVCDGENFARATKYSYTVKGNGSLKVSPAQAVPRYNIVIQKDAGIGAVKFCYSDSPFDVEYDSYTSYYYPKISDTIYKVTYGAKFIGSISPTINEGYKFVGSSANYYEMIKQDGQCVIMVSSEKGKDVSLMCPAIPAGADSYKITLVSTVYSRNCETELPAYVGQSNPSTITSRTVAGVAYKFYDQDVIRIEATRKEGYKLPTLGKTGDITDLTLSKQVTLTDNTTIVVQSGEAGVKIALENNALASGEFVLMDVKSDYNDGREKVQNPLLYIGDEISIPLDPRYRIGTLTKRKPGVGLSGDSTDILPITFSQDIKYVIPSSISKLNVILQQGADRVVSSSFNPKSRVLDIRKEGTFTSDDWGQIGRCDNVIPEAGLGEEGFFINTLSLVYYTKRYLADIVGDKFNKYSYSNIPNSFSYGCTSNLGNYYSGVLKGSYNISENKTFINVKITEYNRNWVANTTHGVYFFAKEIII